MVSSGLSPSWDRLGGATSTTGDQLYATAQVVAQVHHADLIFVTNPADAAVINAPEGLFHERKSVFDPRPRLRLAGVCQLLLFESNIKVVETDCWPKADN